MQNKEKRWEDCFLLLSLWFVPPVAVKCWEDDGERESSCCCFDVNSLEKDRLSIKLACSFAKFSFTKDFKIADDDTQRLLPFVSFRRLCCWHNSPISFCVIATKDFFDFRIIAIIVGQLMNQVNENDFRLWINFFRPHDATQNRSEENLIQLSDGSEFLGELLGNKWNGRETPLINCWFQINNFKNGLGKLLQFAPCCWHHRWRFHWELISMLWFYEPFNDSSPKELKNIIKRM